MTDITQYIKPKWLSVLTDMVRPGGVALMFLFLTVLPLIFSILELGFEGTGTKLAGVLAAYFKAVPDIYYTTLQVMFVGYVAGKSGEVIASQMSDKKKISTPATPEPVLETTGPLKGRENDGLVN
jgi:hypothetical protein